MKALTRFARRLVDLQPLTLSGLLALGGGVVVGAVAKQVEPKDFDLVSRDSFVGENVDAYATVDLADLATGGRDLIGTQEFERLEPLYDDDATSADGPSSP